MYSARVGEDVGVGEDEAEGEVEEVVSGLPLGLSFFAVVKAHIPKALRRRIDTRMEAARAITLRLRLIRVQMS